MTTHCNCNGNLIPHGNDFYLAIALKNRSLVDGEVVETPFDFEAADTYDARIYSILDGTTLSTMVGLKDGTTDTVIIDAKGVPLIRAIGVEVTGTMDGRAFRAAEKGFISIVEFNGEARVVFTPVTGGQEANLVMTLTFLPSAAVVGKNAYEIWKEEPGNQDKTLADFIYFLGHGESAYEIAVRYGYTGTEAEYNMLYFDAVDVANTAGQNAQQAADTANEMAAQAQDAAELADAATANANNAATAAAATVDAAIDNMEDTLNAAIAAQDAEIEEQFATQTALINQKQMEIGAVPYDPVPTAGSSKWVPSGGIKSALTADNITYDKSQSGLSADDVQGAIDEVGKDIFDMTTTPSTTLWNQGFRQTTTTTERSDVIYSNWQLYPDGVLIKTTEDYFIHSIIVLYDTPIMVGGGGRHAMTVNYGNTYFVINIKRENGQNLTPSDGENNVTLNTATTVLKATDIIDDVVKGGSSKVLSAEQGKRIADNIFDPYIFHMGDINYQTGVQSEGGTTHIYLKDYIEIDAQVTPVLKYMGNTLTAGNRYYDENKTYLGTSYTENAVYWRVSAYLGGAESDVETVNKNTTLTINGEEYHGGSLKALAEKVYLNDIFKEDETVRDAIDELRLKTDALDVAVLPIPSDGIRKNRTLIWHDEFNTPTVSEKWDNLSGAYNQNYYMGDVNKNAFCMDNSLHLTNLKDYPTENFDYSGAFLLTNKKFDFRYGLIEAKIKFPDNYEHFHSTLWMIGSSFEWNSGDTNKGMRWPKCGEIDIAECDDDTVNSTVHWGETEDASSEQSHQVVNYYGSSRRSGWHVYSLEWTSTGLSFYCDGTLFSGVPLSRYDIDGFNAFKRSMYFALNQNPHNVKNPRQWSTLDEITTEVAWIRVYAPTGVTPTIPTTATLSETSLSMNVGDSVDLDVTFDNDETVIDRTVVWESYNEDVATFHGGRVIATGVGTTFVACTHKYGARALCKVVVS